MSDSKRIEVVIDGMKFFVCGDDDEKYIKDLAKELDGKIKETSKSNYKLNQVQSLVLLSLIHISEPTRRLMASRMPSSA